MKTDLEQLKRQAGRKPFERRLRLSGDFAACPFHTGDSDKSAHLFRYNDGSWALKCFSSCNESWDVIAFVQKFDNVDFAEAVRRIGGKSVPSNGNGNAVMDEAPKPKPAPLKTAEFAAWGSDLTPADVDRLVKSRKGKGHTPGFETWQRLGCRVKGDYIGFPARHPNGEFLYTLKMRHLDKKDFTAENAAANDGLFNLDTVNPLEPVYIVEGEPDVAVLEEMDYSAVSVLSASQSKFDKHALAVIAEAPEIYIVGDQVIPKRGHDDDPGAKCMDKLEAALEALPGVQHKLYRIRFAVDGIEKEKALKDVSAMRAHYGEDDFRRRFEELKSKAQEWSWVDENIPTVNRISRKPQRWVIDRFLPEGCLTMICGDMGSTKSILALFLAKYLTAPMPKSFLGRKIEGNRANGFLFEVDEGRASFFRDEPVAPVPVLYIDRENAESTVGERLSKIGVIGRDNFRYWGDWTMGERMPEPDDARLLKWAQQSGGLIVFDSLQDWYGDRKEIDTSAMVELMEKFKHLARQCAGVVVLHHRPKPDAEGKSAPYRGGTGIIALSDMAIGLEKMRVDGEEIFALRPIRFRMCGEWQMDYKINWNADGQGSHAIGVIKDKLVSELVAESKAQKETKAAENESADNAARETLTRLIIGSGCNIGATELVANAAVGSRTKVDRLLAGHWTFKATRTPKWQPIASPVVDA